MKFEFFVNNTIIDFPYSEKEIKRMVGPGSLRLSANLNAFSQDNSEELFLTLNLSHTKRKICNVNKLGSVENCLFEKGKILFGQAVKNDKLEYGNFTIIPKVDDKIIIPFGNNGKNNATWEAIIDLDFQSNDDTPVEYELVNRNMKFENTEISTNFKGGEINIIGKNKPNRFNITLYKIEELDGNGVLIGEGKNLMKHRISNFSAINFETNYSP